MSIPKYQIGKVISFFNESGTSTDMGTVKNISIMLREDYSCGVYYQVLNTKDQPVVVSEDLIVNNPRPIRTPAYTIGDNVLYEAYVKEKTLEDCEGIISSINIVQHSEGDDVYYIMEDDPNYLVAEEDIDGIVEYVQEVVV